jgi:hypothetical protein
MNRNSAKPASTENTLQKQGNSYTNSPLTRNQQALGVEPTSYLQSLDIPNSSVPKKENAC